MDRLIQLGSDISELWGQYGGTYIHGAVNTIVLAVLCTAVGCLIGFVCGILQTIPHSKSDNAFKRAMLCAIRVILRVYVEVFRGTPMILQAVFIFFAVPYFSNNSIRFDNVWVAGFLVVSVNTGAYMAETVRGGILSVDPGQTEGSKAIGMTHFQTMLYVILPQTMRNILPQIGNNLIINVKDTSVMFIIGFAELFAVHKAVVGATYLYFPSAAITMGIYLVMTLVCSFILRYTEHRLEGSADYDLATSDTLAHTSGTLNYIDRDKKRATEQAKLAENRKKAGVSDVMNTNLDQNERGR
ncbi:MAG: amino acid ABC transporter permease [Oscillospiraceae bacterium]|nr:amino acid ABC transporter permease [Oscillospiraceae bacterium]